MVHTRLNLWRPIRPTQNALKWAQVLSHSKGVQVLSEHSYFMNFNVTSLAHLGDHNYAIPWFEKPLYQLSDDDTSLDAYLRPSCDFWDPNLSQIEPSLFKREKNEKKFYCVSYPWSRKSRILRVNVRDYCLIYDVRVQRSFAKKFDLIMKLHISL